MNETLSKWRKYESIFKLEVLYNLGIRSDDCCSMPSRTSGGVMTTFTTEDRILAQAESAVSTQIQILERISNDHYKEMAAVFNRKALTDEEIDTIAFKLHIPHSITHIVRAVELAHGISQTKEQSQDGN
jgi:hypothetical protein